MLKKLLFLLVLITQIINSLQNNDYFNEELFIKPLQSGHVNSYFQFTTKWDLDKNDSRKLGYVLILNEKTN